MWTRWLLVGVFALGAVSLTAEDDIPRTKVLTWQLSDLGSGMLFRRVEIRDRGCVDLFQVTSWTGSVALQMTPFFDCNQHAPLPASSPQYGAARGTGGR